MKHGKESEEDPGMSLGMTLGKKTGRRFRAGLLLGLSLTWVSVATSADTQELAVFQIEFTNPKMLPSHWLLKLNPDGSGRFDSEGMASSPAQTGQIEASDVHRSVQVSHAFADQVFAVARRRNFFAFPCDSHLKVAFQGTKRLSYSGPDGSGACEYNYSKDKEIQSLGDSLLAVESTILFGARLEKLLVHDRLGLDQEMGDLVTASKEGNAREVGIIRDILERIAADDQVLERERKRARLLLEQQK